MNRIVLKTRLVGQKKGFVQSQEFRDKFLSSPCECCGSDDHSLLCEMEGPRTRSKRVRYQYSCPLAEYEELYELRYPEEEIHISFSLAADEYAMMHNYDEELALTSLPKRYHINVTGHPSYMDSFIIEVRRLCMINYGLTPSTGNKVVEIRKGLGTTSFRL